MYKLNENFHFLVCEDNFLLKFLEAISDTWEIFYSSLLINLLKLNFLHLTLTLKNLFSLKKAGQYILNKKYYHSQTIFISSTKIISLKLHRNLIDLFLYRLDLLFYLTNSGVIQITPLRIFHPHFLILLSDPRFFPHIFIKFLLFS